MTSTTLSQADLTALVADLVGAGTHVIAPVLIGDGKRTEYRPIGRIEEAALGGPLPRRSLKELFLPPSEVLLRYRQRKDGVELHEVPTTFAPRVILGARPCDAAGVETLDKVMGWDYRDELWFGRRDATAIVSLACPGVDSSCFCGAVGLGPDTARGSDVVLVPLGRPRRAPSSGVAALLEGQVDAFLHDAAPFAGGDVPAGDATEPEAAAAPDHLARVMTVKGEALLKGRGRPATEAELARAEAFAQAARRRVSQDLAGVGRLPEWLARNFDHPLWRSLALRCHGCGACAAVCSTCHCFDIVDEHDRHDRGCRRRNWDSCQTAKFTLHASGHNPRQTQTERLRQRVMHKFSIYPRRFDALLCTGCGRCARTCAAGMNLPEILGRLVHLADADTDAAGRAS